MALAASTLHIVSSGDINQNVTTLDADGNPFKVKVFLSYWAGAADGAARRIHDISNGFGASIDRPLAPPLPVNGQGCSSWSSENGVPVSNTFYSLATQQTAADAACLMITDPADGSVITRARMGDTTVGNMPLVWTTPQAGLEFYGLALGGDDIEEYAIVLHPKPFPLANPDPVTFGFMPDVVLCGVSGGSGMVTTAARNPSWSFGAASREDNSQWASGFMLSDNVHAVRSQRTDRLAHFYGYINTTETLKGSCSVSAWTPTGIVLNWSDSAEEVDMLFLVAIKGGRWRAGSFIQTPTVVAEGGTPVPANLTTGFPINRGLITASFGAAPSNAFVVQSRFSLGTATPNNQNCTWLGKRRLDTPAIAARSASLSRALILRGEVSGAEAVADSGSWRATNFNTPNEIGGEWTFSDGFGRQVLYLAIGEELKFPVSGTVTGLQAGATLTLQINGEQDIVMNADGPFAFANPVGGDYVVSYLGLPISQDCAITGGSNGDGTGTITAAVTDITITCVDVSFTITGTVSGLIPGSTPPLIIRNHAQVDTLILANGPHTFVTSILRGDTWSLTPQQVPTNPPHSVVITNGSGTATADVNNVVIALTALFAADDIASPDGHWSLQGDYADLGTGGNDGVPSGNPQFVTGRHQGRQAIFLNGTTQHIDLPGTAVTFSPIPQTQEFTVAAWARKDVETDRGFIIGNTLDRLQNGFGFIAEYFGGQENTLRGLIVGNHGASLLQVDAFSNTQALSGTGWYHVAATFSGQGETGTLYINGVPVATIHPGTEQALATGAMALDLSIGRATDQVDALLRFSGAISDVYLYNRTLDAQGIANLYALNPKPALGTPLMHWSLDQETALVSQGAGTSGLGMTLQGYTSPVAFETDSGRISGLNFNGIDQRGIALGSQALLGFIPNTLFFTASLFFKLNDLADRGMFFATQAASSARALFLMYDPAFGIRFGLFDATASALHIDTRSPGVVTDLLWHHLVISYGGPGETMRMWLDAVPVAFTYAASNPGVVTGNPPGDLVIGGSLAPSQPTHWHNVIMDDICMWPESADQADVDALFATGRVGLRPPSVGGEGRSNAVFMNWLLRQDQLRRRLARGE